ncbi:FARX-like protein [Mya arenaria]|uniref:FARX-like protein n=1 Tax=Mya arenaria TaxID=6604 RepID=A0ABY7FXY9_MYAAR|nr:FARX-like protein [Mya arenaria]
MLQTPYVSNAIHPFILAIGSDPSILAIGSDPFILAIGSDPFILAIGSDPFILSIGSDPFILAIRSDPFILSIGADPFILSIGSDPFILAIGSDLFILSISSDPFIFSIGSDPFILAILSYTCFTHSIWCAVLHLLHLQYRLRCPTPASPTVSVALSYTCLTYSIGYDVLHLLHLQYRLRCPTPASPTVSAALSYTCFTYSIGCAVLHLLHPQYRLRCPIPASPTISTALSFICFTHSISCAIEFNDINKYSRSPRERTTLGQSSARLTTCSQIPRCGATSSCLPFSPFHIASAGASGCVSLASCVAPSNSARGRGSLVSSSAHSWNSLTQPSEDHLVTSGSQRRRNVLSRALVGEAPHAVDDVCALRLSQDILKLDLLEGQDRVMATFKCAVVA